MITEIYIDTISNEVLTKNIYYYKDGMGIEVESYYLNDELHRIDGPAVIWYDEDNIIASECYYLNGKETMDYLQKEKTNNEKIIEEHKEENPNIKQTKKRRIFIIED